MELLLIRHGESAGDAFAEPAYPAEGYLSHTGERQAIELGKAVADVRVDEIWTSTYGRAIRTAALVFPGQSTRQLPFLCEWMPNRNLRTADATRWESINREAGNWHAEETWKTELGEGCLEFLARVGPPFLKELATFGVHARHGGFVIDEPAQDKRLAVVAHGGSLATLAGFLLGLPPFPVPRFNFHLTGMAVLRMHRMKEVWYPQLALAAPGRPV